MSNPQRIQLRRTKGWRKPEGVIVVARPTKWGNEYRIGDCYQVDCRSHGRKHWHVYGPPGRSLEFVDKTEAAKLAVRLYERDHFRRGRQHVIEVFDELQGHDLACWCPLDQPCHADYLLALADGPRRMLADVAARGWTV